jgi:hypothetical protein
LVSARAIAPPKAALTIIALEALTTETPIMIPRVARSPSMDPRIIYRPSSILKLMNAIALGWLPCRTQQKRKTD